MLDWLKFFPYAHSRKNNPDEIRGPYRSALVKRSWQLGDNIFRFLAPKSNPIWSFSGRSRSTESLSPNNKDILNADLERISYINADAPKNNWGTFLFYSDTWYFVGPWFSGDQARLKAKGMLIQAEPNSEFEGKNLFHPSIFENAIGNYLDRCFGFEKVGSKPLYRGPLNWQTINLNSSIKTVLCDIHMVGNTSIDSPCLYRQIFFPVSAKQFIRISFDFGGVDILNDKLRAEPLLSLCQSIIDSFQLEAGENTLNEWNRVKESYPGASISETMGEFQWPLKNEKKSNRPKEVDITPSKEPEFIEHQSNEAKD